MSNRDTLANRIIVASTLACGGNCTRKLPLMYKGNVLSDPALNLSLIHISEPTRPY